MGIHICTAAETICLKTGFCLDAESHSSAGNRIVLQLGTGTVEIAPEEIASIQALPSNALSDHPASQPVQGQPTAIDVLTQAAYQQGLGRYEDFVRSVAKIESGLKQTAVSPKGAIGLMQLMPGTASELRVDSHDAAENALGGAKYLRSLLIRYHGDSALALAAYNAGPAAVDRFHGVPPYEETRAYVVRVLREYEREHGNHTGVQIAGKSPAAHPPASSGQ
ncbi:MAG: lytic transglycosylase domain-containing protein [Acidobacteriaceae bacterium]|nr:lytic transglycosylase domain-containing protein [Acidobacteriaceae bacterium]MBV8572819.1 lytic transglycosylase domain-containing protein [Acidobacteriaceae bacterium]